MWRGRLDPAQWYVSFHDADGNPDPSEYVPGNPGLGALRRFGEYRNLQMGPFVLPDWWKLRTNRDCFPIFVARALENAFEQRRYQAYVGSTREWSDTQRGNGTLPPDLGMGPLEDLDGAQVSMSLFGPGPRGDAQARVHLQIQTDVYWNPAAASYGTIEMRLVTGGISSNDRPDDVFRAIPALQRLHIETTAQLFTFMKAFMDTAFTEWLKAINRKPLLQLLNQVF